jgi:hypothetical protein
LLGLGGFFHSFLADFRGFDGEVGDDLRFALIEDLKILALEVANQLSFFVADDDFDLDEVDAQLKGSIGIPAREFGLGFGGFGLRCSRRVRGRLSGGCTASWLATAGSGLLWQSGVRPEKSSAKDKQPQQFRTTALALDRPDRNPLPLPPFATST